MKRLNNKGFTLMSIVILIAIIGILFSIGKVNMDTYRETIDIKNYKLKIDMIEEAVSDYKLKTGKLPTVEETPNINNELESYIVRKYNIPTDEQELKVIDISKIQLNPHKIAGDIMELDESEKYSYVISTNYNLAGKVFYMPGIYYKGQVLYE